MTDALHPLTIRAGDALPGDFIKVRGEWHAITATRLSRSGEGIYLDTVPKPEGASTFVYTDDTIRVRRPIPVFEKTGVIRALIYEYVRDFPHTDEDVDRWTEDAVQAIERAVHGPQD